MLAEISFYNFVLFLHITGVVIAFGVVFTYPLVFAVARRSHQRHLPFFHTLQGVIGQRVISTFGTLILLAGIYLAIEGPYDFSDPWIGITLLILIIVLGGGGGYLGPREQKLAELSRRDVDASPPDGPVSFSTEYEKLYAQTRAATLTFLGLVLVAIFLMATKPGA
jgi:drug/metabolite transporter (DMT)-like permease